MSAAPAKPNERFQKMLQAIRGFDRTLVEHSEVCEHLALERSHVHRLIHDRQLPAWLSFGGRQRFWMRDSVQAIERALAARYCGDARRQAVHDVEQKHLAWLRRCADHIRSMPTAEDDQRFGPCRDRRLLTFDEVCEPDQPFSLVRLHYSRQHLANLRALGRFPIAVRDGRGDLLRVDVLDVAFDHLQTAIENLTTRLEGRREQEALPTH